jgi:MFS family permease
MNPKRLTLGALLPVPIYCLGSAVYGLNGLVRHPEDIPMLMILWLGYGYLIMGIPSVIYSFAMEALRSKEHAGLAVCSVIGAVFGFICGSLFFLFDSQPIVFYTMSLPGSIIGGVIPILLSIRLKIPDKR